MGNFRNIVLPFAIAASVISGAASAAAGQTPVPRAEPRVRVAPRPPMPPETPTDSELRVDVDPNVNIKFCVAEAKLKINGWERDEVRMFVRGGRKFGFRVLEKSPSTGKANWLWITPGVPANAGNVGREPMPECLSGDSVELDVPIGATVNVTGRSTDTIVDSVKKVSVKIVEGNIALRNITGGITAHAFQGDLMVENSAGAITLESTTGNVIAYDVAPGEIGELFRVKTNSGAVMMQNVEHRQIEANSITGSVSFDGNFLPGGVYSFKTSNGSIRLAVPESTAATFKAIYGFGSFNSEMPLNYTFETNSPTGKNIVATLGGGGSNVSLTTNSGSIRILKRK